MEQSTHILLLPDDCLYFIFQRLDSSSDRDAFGLTCRRWLRIQSSCRRSLHFQCSFSHRTPASLPQDPISIGYLHLYRVLNRYPRLHSLSLCGCTELPDSGLALLMDYGPRLTSLRLDCCFGISDDGLFSVARGCPSLTDLSLYRCNITDTGLKALSESCLALEDVNLSYCSRVTDAGIRALSRNCRRLRAVNISHCRGINGTGFEGCSRSLAYLEADSCKLDPKGIRAMLSGGGLEYLDISNLTWCIQGHGFAALDTRLASKLTVLNFRVCRHIDDESVARIARGCPSLREWNLALCHEISVVGWESIAMYCCALERLHVNRCRNLCDRGLQALREGCGRLRKLHLGRCCRVSSTAIEVFKLLRGDVVVSDEEVMCIAPR
ncbi:F-box/LRR-repeat protein 12-like [Salvia splendens]|uniref:F-box/LRR-repeat protein 12-like n=1 Tax=Salvia splendens TaxID=180675 RepID=UPI001C26E51C|nr:F-box/LRR-repeat protein 12-like [Salvia splendens]